MTPLPNAAEQALGEEVGRPGFEDALWGFLCCMALDDLLVLAHRDAGPPEVRHWRADAPEVFARVGSVYLGGAYLLDPWHELHLSRAAPGVYRLSEGAPDAFRRSRYFLEPYEFTRTLDELTFVTCPAPDVSLHVCLGRDASSGHSFAPLVAAPAERHWAVLPVEPGPRTDVATRLVGALREAHGVRLSPRQAEVALLILCGHSPTSSSRSGAATRTWTGPGRSPLALNSPRGPAGRIRPPSTSTIARLAATGRDAHAQAGHR